MSTWKTPQRIWLTGATSGIGEALARKLIAQGHQVVLSARSDEALEALCRGHPNAHPLPLDISDRQAVLKAGNDIREQLGALNLALFNAGTCEYLNAQQFDMDLVERVLKPNLFGTLYGVEAALPLLRAARKEGLLARLAATSSASAYLPLPRAEAYGASKAAVSYFLESLRLDLDQEGIEVSLIHPGFVKTPLTERNDFPMPMQVTAEQAADAIIAGLVKGRLDIHFPCRFTYLVKLLGILPPTVRRQIGLRMTRSQKESS
ncbi:MULTISPECIES: SDR family NAD(P)-dependent oxidoreductase [Halomonadaceae]|uniref:SDR family NAD(P)-dependent oxidoreductase n=1 Tax=Halomonadaceae TaxID=28256 RepID=UPI0012EF22F0|nr:MULTISPECIES: SDR family NAD(P)-dependent oxidoreductase [Halomonas]CAD5246966.1 Oxidoreductase, short-chain dehydrogenase/reductase family [Halomonas sp. I3]CAD5268323.1 SDR family oxidoreductase [Halomonas sp. 113]CAD5270357.1 SDR family oxidoreductase [Halomonas sp. 59]CAD5283209.1 SDR family oxidoreductase [Halomonas sp. 156]VXB69051.1 SDR family oxidoreductase [Halomonas titanicae]